MLIDWFTVIAQIINFLILAALLSRFLFKPILKRVDRRKKELQEEREHVEKKEEAAAKREREYEEKMERIEKKKKELLEEGRMRAEEEKEKLLKDAREKIEKKKEQWRNNLEKEKIAQERMIKKAMEASVLTVAGKLLKTFAGAELRDQMVDKMVEQLKGADQVELPEDNEQVAIHSSFELSDQSKKRIEEQAQKLFGKRRIAFKKDDDLLGGLMIKAGSYQLYWSPYQYLDDLKVELEQQHP